MPAAWTPPAAADLKAGKRAALEHWCFLRLLGDGDVLRGYDMHLDRWLAAERLHACLLKTRIESWIPGCVTAAPQLRPSCSGLKVQ